MANLLEGLIFQLKKRKSLLIFKRKLVISIKIWMIS